MAKITRPNLNVKAFGSQATGTSRTVFGDTSQSDDLTDNLTTEYFKGWNTLGTKPPRQWFNGVLYTNSQLISYLFQTGIPEWNTNQEYHLNSIINYEGTLYRSKTNNNIGNNPETDTVKWYTIIDASSITIEDSGDYFDSTNVEDALQEIGGALTKTATPILSGNTSAPEGSQQIITITNYSATATYTINVESGSFVRDGANITWTLPAFTGVDDIHDLTVSAKDITDVIESDTATFSMTVLDIESDQTILYEGGTINATTVPTIVNGTVANNKFEATADNAVFTTALVSQDVGDGDFVNAVPTMDSKAIGFGVYKSGADNTSTTTATEIHTADVGINGTASASTTADSGNLAHEAFDRDSTSQWSSSTPISWLQYQFNTAKAIDKVIIFNDSINSDRMIKDFTIKASNTGAFSGEEVTLTTVVGETNWGASESRIFTFTNSISYSYYRIDITANNGNVTYTHIAEVNFIESQAQYTNTSITVSGQTLTDGDTVLLNDGASVDLIEFDTTGNVTDNGDSTYTLDLTSASLTNAPTQVLKDVPTLSTSIVASGGADSFEERTPQSFTADTDGTTTATEITTLFDVDDRRGREVKHRVSMNDGDEVTRIQTPIDRLV
jgi:mannose/fructose/N-acetylgalactosamine-specific phosphotransferase system component IIB